MKYDSCPICFFDDLPYPPIPYYVCICCGTEFGVADYYRTPEQLRELWIDGGKRWFSDLRKPPKDWNPDVQLIRGGYTILKRGKRGGRMATNG